MSIRRAIMATKKRIENQIKRLEAKLNTSIKGKRRSEVRRERRALRRQLAGPKARKKKPHKVNPEQGFLPNFLSQQDMVRIEEMLVEKTFKQVAEHVADGIRKRFGLTKAG